MASRRNSESVFHGAVAIAAAVPQLMVHPGNSMSTSNIPATTSGYPENKLTSSASAASQDNLVNVESTMMSSSTSRIGMISHKKSLKAYYYDKHVGLHFVQYQFERLDLRLQLFWSCFAALFWRQFQICIGRSKLIRV